MRDVNLTLRNEQRNCLLKAAFQHSGSGLNRNTWQYRLKYTEYLNKLQKKKRKKN